MPDQSSKQLPTHSGGTITIPEEVYTQHTRLIDLVARSESMNDEERQYWVNILPIMTPDQIKSLDDILTNERTQLDAIDAKYAKEIDNIGQEEFVKQVEEERQKKLEERQKAEQKAQSAEEEKVEDVLKQMENL